MTGPAVLKSWKRIFKHNTRQAYAFMKNSDQESMIAGKDFP
ncbi:hypothetical protein BH10PSE11_BH10PSE11_10230 [soil metagenome]